MKRSPRVGETGEFRFVVDSARVIDFANERMPAVLSTPQLISGLERAAREVLAPVLDAGECSVGTHIDVQHLAPTPLGHTVVCRARIIHVDKRVITFQVEAHDHRDLIARGLHKRSVIQVDRFAARVQRKHL